MKLKLKEEKKFVVIEKKGFGLSYEKALSLVEEKIKWQRFDTNNHWYV